ncbi:hypothetical protein [Dankookia sp. P2]|uniref:hypothetical protein n=1 Tax=Dankookia sp. P2 TaxID=3423955 RepID=UPI003D66F376
MDGKTNSSAGSPKVGFAALMTAKTVAEHAFDLQVGLQGADVPEYDAATAVGNAAVLAVNLRGLGEVQYQTLRLVAARHFHVRSDVLDGVLRILADLELVKLVTRGATINTVIPDVPHFEDIYERVGAYVAARPLNELEQLTVALLHHLHQHPMNRDALRAKLGADKAAFDSCLEIGVQAGVMLDQRARGRDIVASPLYFDNLDALIDVAARGDTPHLKRLLGLVKQHQGMPLSTILSQHRIAETSISADEAALLQALASEGIIKPPSIIRPNSMEERFVFTPSPGRVRMSAANREIYEKGMALAAAVRKGQLLPEQVRIRSPQALLSALEDRKWINASSEAAYQYKNLAVLGVGRLVSTGGDFHRFHLIDVPENLQAVRIARILLVGEQPMNLEQDKEARLLLGQDEAYVRSQISAASLRKPTPVPMSKRAEAEMKQLWLQLP